jgi:hypothetical protein
MRLAVMLALAVSVSVPLVAIAPVAADARISRDCGTVSGGVALYDMRATGVSCKFARELGRRWRSKLFADECVDGRFRCRVRGYTCRAKPPAEVHYPVVCRKDSHRVRWQIHAD